MVGQEVNLTVNQKVNQSGSTAEKVILSVEKLQVLDDRKIPAVRNISFELRAGEIFGIAGVDGNGQRELADAIAGLRSIHQGKISFPCSLVHPKIGYIPEDRQKMGLILPFTIGENLILKKFKNLPFCRNLLLQPKAIAQHGQAMVEKFKIRASGENVKVSQLSGGNQQKVVLARELAEEPNLIIAMQPTRGLDVGATATVHGELLAQKKRGAAILYISTELEEVMTMSDRIAVIYRGEFVDILDANTATLDKIGLLMGGAIMA
jgi:simple sugar transport system ATP-binding protein